MAVSDDTVVVAARCGARSAGGQPHGWFWRDSENFGLDVLPGLTILPKVSRSNNQFSLAAAASKRSCVSFLAAFAPPTGSPFNPYIRTAFLLVFWPWVSMNSVNGQGTVNFNNREGVFNTHTYAPLPAAPTYVQTGNGPEDNPAGAQDWTRFSALSGWGERT